MKYQSLFSGENKKNFILTPAEFVQRVVKVKMSSAYIGKKFFLKASLESTVFYLVTI